MKGRKREQRGKASDPHLRSSLGKGLQEAALPLIGHEHTQTHTYVLCIETHLKNMTIHEVTHLIPTQEHEQIEENEGGKRSE